MEKFWKKKERLVKKGYNQHEGIYLDETYALEARLEATRMLLAYVCIMNFKLLQMDVNNVL